MQKRLRPHPLNETNVAQKDNIHILFGTVADMLEFISVLTGQCSRILLFNDNQIDKESGVANRPW